MTDQSSWGPPAAGQQPHWQQPQQPQPQSGGWQQAQPSDQGGWQQPAQPSGGLLLHTSFFPLAFILYLFKPKMSLDGSQPFGIVWGDNPLTVPPGRHHVRVWFPYMFFSECGLAEAVVDVPEQGMRLDYKAPTWFVWNKGSFPSLAQQHQAAAAGAAQGAQAGGGAWHPDPTGRAEQRYWDGQTWTGHVVRGGQQGWDPV